MKEKILECLVELVKVKQEKVQALLEDNLEDRNIVLHLMVCKDEFSDAVDGLNDFFCCEITYPKGFDHEN